MPLPACYLRLAVPFAVAIKGVFLDYLLCPSAWSRSKCALASYLLHESQSDVSALTHFYHQFKLRKQARIYMYISWTTPMCRKSSLLQALAKQWGMVISCILTENTAKTCPSMSHGKKDFWRKTNTTCKENYLKICQTLFNNRLLKWLPFFFWSETHNSTPGNCCVLLIRWRETTKCGKGKNRE